MKKEKTSKFRASLLLAAGIFFFLALFAFSQSALAARYVDFNVYNATVDDEGQRIDGTDPIDNVNAIGFVCASTDCATIGSTLDLATGGTCSSGLCEVPSSGNTVSLVFPTDPLYSNTCGAGGNQPCGYGVYFYKDGWIPWEQNPTLWGTCELPEDCGGTIDPLSADIYLGKKQTCEMPTLTVDAINDVNENEPLQIGVNASLDATAYSPIQAAGPLNYTPPDIQDQYSVNVSVTVTVYDDSQQVVSGWPQTESKLIQYSQEERFEFDWTPTTAGDYTAVATAVAVDAKCLAANQAETPPKAFQVLTGPPQNMCYSLLANLTFSNPYPHDGNPLTVSVEKISNYADPTGTLSPVATNATLEVKDSQDQVVFQDNATWAANPDAIDYVNFSFAAWTPAVEGDYNVTVTAVADDPQCSGLTNDPATAPASIHVYGNEAPTADIQGSLNPSGPWSQSVTGTISFTVYFNASNSTDPDNNITTYDWDFDGDSVVDATTAIPTTSSVYSSASTYTVVLTVTDDMGATDQDTMTVTAQSPSPPPSPPSGGGGGGGGGYTPPPVKIEILEPYFAEDIIIPDDVEVGGIFTISGAVGNFTKGTTVELYEDGEIVTQRNVSTDDGGAFAFDMAAFEIGAKKIKVQIKGTEEVIEKDVLIHADVQIVTIDVPDDLVAGAETTISVELGTSWPSDAEIALFEDGTLIEKKAITTAGSETVTFAWTPEKDGETTLTAVANIFGERAEKTVTAQVAPAGILPIPTGWSLADAITSPAGIALIAIIIVAIIAVRFKDKLAVLTKKLGEKFVVLLKGLVPKKQQAEQLVQ